MEPRAGLLFAPRNSRSVSGNTTLVARDNIVLVSATATMTLPASPITGKPMRIANTGTLGTDVVTISAGVNIVSSGAAATSYKLAAGESVDLIYDGTVWRALPGARVQLVYARGTTTVTPAGGGAYSTINFGTELLDAFAAFASNVFTVPYTRYYRISAEINVLLGTVPGTVILRLRRTDNSSDLLSTSQAHLAERYQHRHIQFAGTIPAGATLEFQASEAAGGTTVTGTSLLIA